jgi:hypothetical protein
VKPEGSVTFGVSSIGSNERLILMPATMEGTPRHAQFKYHPDRTLPIEFNNWRLTNGFLEYLPEPKEPFRSILPNLKISPLNLAILEYAHKKDIALNESLAKIDDLEPPEVRRNYITLLLFSYFSTNAHFPFSH